MTVRRVEYIVSLKLPPDTGSLDGMKYVLRAVCGWGQKQKHDPLHKLDQSTVHVHLHNRRRRKNNVSA
jgi:hypothetical protein